MGLRMILVGVVACLGLTMPTGEQIESCKVSAQTWMNARIAEWDAPLPADENAFVLVAEPTATDADEATPASGTPALETPNATAAPVTAATETPTDSRPAAKPVSTIASNDLADGLAAPTVPMAFEETDLTPATASPAPEPTASDAGFDAAQNDVLSAFERDRPEAAAPVALAPAFEPIEVGENLDTGVAYALNHAAEGLSITGTAGVPHPSTRFEPMENGEDLYSGVAYDLNRGAEGLETAAPTVTSRVTLAQNGQTNAPGSTNRLTHAVRLTRDAMNAWANLLHGPAVVLITH